MHKFLFPLFAAVFALVASQSLAAQAMMSSTDMIRYGYPDVLGVVYFHPGKEASITLPDQAVNGMARGSMTITIPADAFTVPVKFEVLAGKNAAWDSSVPANLEVVANYAFRVTDLKTGELIENFSHPVTYSVTDPMITSDSVYWATTANDPAKLIDANAASVIKGDTLTHEAPLASVGWIITTPRSELAGRM